MGTDGYAEPAFGSRKSVRFPQDMTWRPEIVQSARGEAEAGAATRKRLRNSSAERNAAHSNTSRKRKRKGGSGA